MLSWCIFYASGMVLFVNQCVCFGPSVSTDRHLWILMTLLSLWLFLKHNVSTLIWMDCHEISFMSPSGWFVITLVSPPLRLLMEHRHQVVIWSTASVHDSIPANVLLVLIILTSQLFKVKALQKTPSTTTFSFYITVLSPPPQTSAFHQPINSSLFFSAHWLCIFHNPTGYRTACLAEETGSFSQPIRENSIL